MQVQGDQGDGLAQAHVVSQAGAESEGGHLVQPGQASQLVVPQRRPQRRGGFQRCAAGGGLGVGQALLQLREPAAGDDVDPCPVGLCTAGQDRGQPFDGSEGAGLAVPGPAQRLGVDHHPLVA